MRITRDALRALGSCSDYLRKFRDNFPVSEYPEGVEVTREFCARYAEEWDWGWAAERMFTNAGYQEFRRLAYDSNEDEELFGRYDTYSSYNNRPASVFGHLFETRPDFHSEHLVSAVQEQQAATDDRILHTLNDATYQDEQARAQLAYWIDLAPRRAAALVAAQEAAVGARIRKADRRITTAAQEIAHVEALLAAARNEAENAATARAELPETIVTEETSTESGETTTDEAATSTETATTSTSSDNTNW